MARPLSRFNRKEPRLKPQARVLVICEDSKSSRLYLQAAAHHFRAYAEVEIAHCGKNDPKGIVEEAVKRQKNFDHIYCAIDRDSDPKFDAALNQAAAHAKETWEEAIADKGLNPSTQLHELIDLFEKLGTPHPIA